MRRDSGHNARDAQAGGYARVNVWAVPAAYLWPDYASGFRSKRRIGVIGIFPNDEAIIRLVGSLMLDANNEWAVAPRYMSLETLA